MGPRSLAGNLIADFVVRTLISALSARRSPFRVVTSAVARHGMRDMG